MSSVATVATESPTLRSHTPKGSRARGKIVRAAERLLASTGFHGTSMRDVAEAAGLPLASVVYHFAKKEQLYAAVLAEIAEHHVSEMTRALEDQDQPWATRLDTIVRSLVAWTATHPGRVKLLLRELLDNPARVARASRLPLAPVLLRLSEFVAAGMRAGAFRTVIPETSVLHLVGAVSYFVAARPTVRRIVGPARYGRMSSSYEREAIGFARRMFLALEPEVYVHGSVSVKTASLASKNASSARCPSRSRIRRCSPRPATSSPTT
jgi:AcrR family transcriptional regulator